MLKEYFWIYHLIEDSLEVSLSIPSAVFVLVSLKSFVAASIALAGKSGNKNKKQKMWVALRLWDSINGDYMNYFQSLFCFVFTLNKEIYQP